MRFADIILRELGETKEGYDWNLVDKDSRSRIYEFRTENYKYRASVSYSKISPEWLYYTFDTEDNDEMFKSTDEGKQFQIMATVLDIAQDAWENRDQMGDGSFKGFEFDTDRQKAMLYKKFIRTQFPSAEVTGGKAGQIKVELPQ